VLMARQEGGRAVQRRCGGDIHTPCLAEPNKAISARNSKSKSKATVSDCRGWNSFFNLNEKIGLWEANLRLFALQGFVLEVSDVKAGHWEGSRKCEHLLLHSLNLGVIFQGGDEVDKHLSRCGLNFQGDLQKKKE
jgi:hypothetical protein